MRLLIITQAVDKNDPVLGFFHRWIEEFADKCDSIEVLCLRMGEHQLPGSVRITSLGKERRASRFEIVRNLYRYIWNRRKEYDAVFVHMNQEYVLLCGILWRIMRKRIVFWRNYRTGTWMTRIAVSLSHKVCYTSPQSYTARFKKSIQMQVGIDISQYGVARAGKPGSLLWLGRIDPIKRFHLVMAALQLLAEDGVSFTFDVYGEPTKGREGYLADIRKQFSALEDKGYVRYRGSVTHDKTPAVYASHEVFVNLTPAGSFDKTIFEAMAAGCLVVVSNSDLRHIVSNNLFVQSDHVESIAMAVKDAISLSSEEAKKESMALRSYVAENHSLESLVSNALNLLRAPL